MTVKYIGFDSKEFDSENDCLAYETRVKQLLLSTKFYTRLNGSTRRWKNEIDAKYKVGDQVWTAGYCEGHYYASRHSYVIDSIQIKITAQSIFVIYEIYNDNIRFTEPEDLIFPTHDACVRWCQSQNILGE